MQSTSRLSAILKMLFDGSKCLNRLKAGWTDHMNDQPLKWAIQDTLAQNTDQ